MEAAADYFSGLGLVRAVRLPSSAPSTAAPEEEAAFVSDLSAIVLKERPHPVRLVYVSNDIEGRLQLLLSAFPTLPVQLDGASSPSSSSPSPFSPLPEDEADRMREAAKERGQQMLAIEKAKQARAKAAREARVRARVAEKARAAAAAAATAAEAAASTSSSAASDPNPAVAAAASALDDEDDDLDGAGRALPVQPAAAAPLITVDLPAVPPTPRPLSFPALRRITFVDPTGLHVAVERARASPAVPRGFRPALPLGFTDPLPGYALPDEDDDDGEEDGEEEGARGATTGSGHGGAGAAARDVAPLALPDISFTGLLIPVPAVLGPRGASLAVRFWKRLGHSGAASLLAPVPLPAPNLSSALFGSSDEGGIPANSHQDYALCSDGLVVLAFLPDAPALLPRLRAPSLFFQAVDDAVFRAALDRAKARKSVPAGLTVSAHTSRGGSGLLLAIEAPAPSAAAASATKGEVEEEEDGAAFLPLIVVSAPRDRRCLRLTLWLCLIVATLFMCGLAVAVVTSPAVRRTIINMAEQFVPPNKLARMPGRPRA